MFQHEDLHEIKQELWLHKALIAPIKCLVKTDGESPLQKQAEWDSIVSTQNKSMRVYRRSITLQNAVKDPVTTLAQALVGQTLFTPSDGSTIGDA